MKNKSIVLCAALALSTASSLFADITVTVTGATAFRAATLASIRGRFNASGAAYSFAHDQAAGGTLYTGATRAIFIGTFPGITGTTTIKCCFTGSVEGIRALVPVTDPLPPTYYQNALLANTTPTIGGAELASQGTTGAATQSSDIAFSDVTKASTPFGAFPLQPASSTAGVIVFTMLGSEGTPFTNVTAQQFRALAVTGYQPVSLFTGVAANTDNVFLTGRNDGSGTRAVYLAENGVGVSTAINQYVTNVSTSTALSTIQLVPKGGVNSTPLPGQLAANASTVWGQDIDGNGGYNSGATLRTDMGKTGGSVTVLDATGADAFGSPQNLSLVTWLSLSDAITARTNGASFLAFNGVRLDGIAASGTTLTAADTEKVTNGAYTAWGYEQMYRRNDITTGDKVTVYNGIKNNLVLGTAGIATTSMAVGRSSDGGTVAP